MPNKLPLKEIIGFVEIVNESGIYGWAYDKHEPAQPTTLHLFIDGKCVQRVECIKLRKDVADAGHARAEVGFHARFPSEFCDGNIHTYYFADHAGDEVNLKFNVSIGDSEASRSFSWNTYFDAQFYTKYYSDMEGTADPAAFEHWLKLGKPQGRFPNHVELLEHLKGTVGALPKDFSANKYQLLNRDIAEKIASEWEAVVHYLEVGAAEGRSYKISSSQFVADVYFDGMQPPEAELERFLLDARETVYLSLDEMLIRNGFTNQTFIKYLNAADYVVDSTASQIKNLMQCIRHFVELGVKECQPLSFDHGFDHAFISELNPEYSGLSKADAYLRWINIGIDAGVAPNAAIFLSNLALSDVSEYPSGFDAEVYLTKNPELRLTLRSRWAALQHFIQQGLAEGRQGCPISKNNCDIFRAAADRCAVSDRLATSKRIYEIVLGEDPNNTLGLRHYADCLLRLNDHFTAVRVYRETIERGKSNIWTYINLSLCFVTLGRWKDACETMWRARAIFPGDRGLVRRHEDILRQSYYEVLKEVEWLAQNKFYSQAKTRAREVCELQLMPLSSSRSSAAVARDRIGVLAILADLGLPQCKFYRVDQKVEQMEAAGLKCKVFNYTSDVEAFTRQIPSVDAVVVYRAPATREVMRAVTMVREAGLPIFYEIDDLMFDQSYFPDTFESYGGQITHDVYARLVTGTAFLSAVLSACDYAIGSTPTLAKAMESQVVSGRSFVHRNALSRLHEHSYRFAGAAGSRRDRVRIFYGSGTRAHKEDFEVNLALPLEQLFRKWREKIEMVIFGYMTLSPALTAFSSQISILEPIWDLHTYWKILREMDINLAVLKPGKLSDSKSEIKWLEAAMLGVPSVVSATKTFQEVVDDGVTGILIKDPRDWYSALDSLVASAASRRKIGSAARDVVLERYSVPSMAENIRRILAAVTAECNPAKKRVLLVNVFFPPQSIGGATRVVADNLRDMRAGHSEEFEFQVFCTLEGGTKAYFPRAYLWEGVKVTAVTTPSEANIDLKAWDERMAEEFVGVVERFQPDIVHLHCIQRITVSICKVLRDKGIPYVVTVHDGWWISDRQFLVDDYGTFQSYDFADPWKEFRRGGRQTFERLKLHQEYLNAAERVLPVSKPFSEIYLRSGFKNIQVIENGVSEFDIQPRQPSPDGRVRLAHIGGASPHKGYNLVRAALFRGNFRNLRLLVIDHAMDPGVERYALWGKTPVTFRGKFSHSSVGELYSQTDVLLAPSIWPESYGLVTREAVMAGCWVVASDRGAIGLDITPETGFVVGVGSYVDLLSVLSEIDRAPQKYTAGLKTPNGIRKASEQAEEIVSLYKEVLASRDQSRNQLPTS